jgi:hypothetical protein
MHTLLNEMTNTHVPSFVHNYRFSYCKMPREPRHAYQEDLRGLQTVYFLFPSPDCWLVAGAYFKALWPASSVQFLGFLCH